MNVVTKNWYDLYNSTLACHKVNKDCNECGDISCPYTDDYIKDDIIEKIWGGFEDIPLNEKEEIDEVFFVWGKGTNRYEIWKWFDENYSSGVFDLMWSGTNE